MNDLTVLPHHSMRQTLKLVLLFVPTVFLTGCVTNLYVEHCYKIAKPPTERPSVFVEETSLTKELAILKASKLYEISEDPTVSKHIVLKPIHHSVHDPIGFFIPIYTLGFLPGGAPARYRFEYILRDKSGEQLLSYELPGIYRSCSLWECFFKPFKSESRVMGKVLRTEALRPPKKDQVNSSKK